MDGPKDHAKFQALIVDPLDARVEVQPATTAETIRLRHLRDEAFVRAAGRFHYVYGLMVLALSVYLAFSIDEMFAASQGKMDDWGYWAALTACIALLSLANFLVGFGLRGLRSWSFRAEYGVFVPILFIFALVLVRVFRNVSVREVGTDAVSVLLLTSPVLVLVFFLYQGDARIVISSEYRTIIAQTRQIKVRPALPGDVRWSLALVAAGLSILYWVAIRTLLLS